MTNNSPSNAIAQVVHPDASNVSTHHAPPERLAGAELHRGAKLVRDETIVQTLLEGFPEVAVILNEHRQIVVCNHALLSLLGLTDDRTIIGKRLGEVLNCVHAKEMSAGCGTAPACRACGAVNAMLACQKERGAARQECRLLATSAQGLAAWELDVLVSPLDIAGMRLLLLVARDIAAQKRRDALERLFYHDTLNIVGGIQGLAHLLLEGEPFDPTDHPKRLLDLSRHLTDQICSQRDLAAAERGDLRPTWRTLAITDLYRSLRAAIDNNPVAFRRRLVFEHDGQAPKAIETDRVLLERVLGNLIKNAFEAIDCGQTVTVRCESEESGQLRFAVHNPGAMPPSVQLQVFTRSFSTKSCDGRGLGTFGAKLLTENYLGGKIGFTSTEQDGTIFSVTVPAQQTPNWRMELSTTQEPSHNCAGARVLLAEDCPENARLISYILRRAGASVILAENGQMACEEVAIAKRRGQPFHVVLMDMNMPEVDGFTAAATLRHGGYPYPIIALTALDDAGSRAKCQRAGCNDHLAKPIDAERLLDLVSRYTSGEPDNVHDGK